MLKVSRLNDFRDNKRRYKIILNNTYCEDIKFGEIKSLDVTPGNHSIYLKIDWCRSNKIDFNVSDNETLEFECGNSMNGWRIWLFYIYITFLKNKYLWIKPKTEVNSIMNTNNKYNSRFKLTLIGYILISVATNVFYLNRLWNDETILWLWITLAFMGSITLLMKNRTHFKKYQKLLMNKDLLFIIPVITIPLLPIRHDFSLIITLIYEIVYILIYIFNYYKKVQ